MRILGIESSCDDSSVAVIGSEPLSKLVSGGDTSIRLRPVIESNIVISQDSAHSEFMGVVPEIAARSHMQNLEKALNLALCEAKVTLGEIDGIAATCGPGLIGGVIVGAMYGKTLSSVLNKPFIAVNHLEGHALTCKLTNGIEYPYLLLLVSGGHCQFVTVQGLGRYKIIGRTIDDAVGEAFDKVAKMLGLEFPGGPKIEKLAKYGNENRFNFPRPIIDRKDANMSFSGLKTAVRIEIEKIGTLTESDKADIAASFQKVVAEILVKKTTYAMEIYQTLEHTRTFVVSGGVAANQYISSRLAIISDQTGYNFVAPPIKLCTDNAAMIAFAGLERMNAGMINNVDFKPRARWSLEDL